MRSKVRARLLASAGLAVTVAVIGLAAPAASAGRTEPADSFSGNCQFNGHSQFTPPLTGVPVFGQDYTTAAGPCSGTFTDRRGQVHKLSNQQVSDVATVRGETSCTAGTLTGAGYLQFPWGRLYFTLTEVHGPGDGSLQITGQRGGSATGTGAVSTSENPVTISEECAGAGLKSVASTVTIATTPTISG